MNACRAAVLRILSVLVLLPVSGCASQEEEQPLSWTEFQRHVHQEAETGIYIVNGDEPAEDIYQLAEQYRRYLDSIDTGIGSSRQPLIVNRVNGADDKWDSTQAMNLTYCVTKSGKGNFGTRYDAVVNAMNA